MKSEITAVALQRPFARSRFHAIWRSKGLREINSLTGRVGWRGSLERLDFALVDGELKAVRNGIQKHEAA